MRILTTLALTLALPTSALAKKPIHTPQDICVTIIQLSASELEDELDHDQLEAATKACTPLFAGLAKKTTKTLFPCILEATSSIALDLCGAPVGDALNAFDPMPNRKRAACENINRVVSEELKLPVPDESIERCMRDMHLQQRLLSIRDMNKSVACATKATTIRANERCWER